MNNQRTELRLETSILDAFIAGAKGALVGFLCAIVLTVIHVEFAWLALLAFILTMLASITGVLGWFAGRGTLWALRRTGWSRLTLRILTSLASGLTGILFFVFIAPHMLGQQNWAAICGYFVCATLVFFIFIPQRELKRTRTKAAG
ncbi:hypothetical protein [Timonella sp. A28]|uniref:hypothetical protein n=1 Tax=Timonella sp. A28 TaxID=3442640 RepID=UPI003EBD879F